jgi:hypothetical protein
MSLFFRAAQTIFNAGGPRVGCINVGVRGGASDSPASGSEGLVRLGGRRLAFALSVAASGCTLTSDPFDPIVVSPNNGESTSVESGLLPGVPVASGGNDPSGEPNPLGSIEETDPTVSLDPNGTAGGQLGGVQNNEGSEEDRSDAGVGVEDGGNGITADGGTPAAPVVPCSGLEYAGSCYELFADLRSWDAAEALCVARDGHLASIQSTDEDAFLGVWPSELGIAPLNGTGIWIGGTDSAANDDFAWSDGAPFDFTGWGQNQPDNGAGVDCIEKRNDTTARWYDQRCFDLRPYICERPL